MLSAVCCSACMEFVKWAKLQTKTAEIAEQNGRNWFAIWANLKFRQWLSACRSTILQGTFEQCSARDDTHAPPLHIFC